MLFQVTITIIVAHTIAKWPDRENDTLIYIANPIEAKLPGHWLPLSIVKKILGGSSKAVDHTQITSTLSEPETTTTKEESTTETTIHKPVVSSESTITEMESTAPPDVKLTSIIDDITTESSPSDDQSSSPSNTIEPPITSPETPTAVPESSTIPSDTPTTTSEPATEPPSTEAKNKTPRRKKVTDAHDNVNN
ncbi:hypothetical protein KGM_206334 [Danaus plexippus plexippus]|uniref:Uncharacterized protein n=1 Tax=Danaus plexippus plexippus TaxID=278856 RepID=A0A212EH33_DANPL|nr:hypothetical protein KGM_206334 [Danaus plexippus plexippus]